jgi:hypothetical protein
LIFEKEPVNLRSAQYTDRFIRFGANHRHNSLEDTEGREFIDIAKRGPLVSRINGTIRSTTRDHEP